MLVVGFNQTSFAATEGSGAVVHVCCEILNPDSVELPGAALLLTFTVSGTADSMTCIL